MTLNDNGDADAGPNGLRNFPVVVSASLDRHRAFAGGFARPGSAIELYIAQADPSGFGEGLTYLGTLTEGSAADLDATTGTYGPANINGLAQGTDNTNRFSFRITVPGGVAIGTRLTGTATIGGETSEFGGNVLVTGGPALRVAKPWRRFPIPSTASPIRRAFRAAMQAVQRARHQPGRRPRRQQRRGDRRYRARQHAHVRRRPGRAGIGPGGVRATARRAAR